MDPSLIELFVYTSRLISLQNPLLVTICSDTMPMSFCSGRFFPITCTCYDAENDLSTISSQLQTPSKMAKEFSPVFVTETNHKALLNQLSFKPLSFSGNRVWIMPLKYMALLPLRLDSKIFFYERAPPGTFNVYEAYAIKGGAPVQNLLYQWTEKDAKQPKGQLLPMKFTEKRSDLGGAMINIGWVGYAKSSFGRGSDIMSNFQFALNFTINTIPATDKAWGAMMKNETWNGLVGMLIDRRIDFTFGHPAGGGMMTTLKRADVVDFLLADSSSTVTLLASPSSKPRINSLGFVNIFPVGIWLTIFGFQLISILCYMLASRELFSQSLALMLRLFLQMPYRMPAKNVSSKILVLLAGLFLKMIFIYYTCTLKAIMTSDTQEIRLRSYEDVVNQEYTIVTNPLGSKSYDILASAGDGSARKIIYQSEFHILRPAGEKCFDALHRLSSMSKVLCLGYSEHLSNRKLQVLDISEAVHLFRATALQKNSEFTELFNHQLLLMLERGNIHKIENRWNAIYEQKYGMEDPIELGYEHVLFPYNILALGIMVAIPIILGEWLSNHILKMKNGPQNLSVLIMSNQDNKIDRLKIEISKMEAELEALLRERNTNE